MSIQEGDARRNTGHSRVESRSSSSDQHRPDNLNNDLRHCQAPLDKNFNGRNYSDEHSERWKKRDGKLRHNNGSDHNGGNKNDNDDAGGYDNGNRNDDDGNDAGGRATRARHGLHRRSRSFSLNAPGFEDGNSHHDHYDEEGGSQRLLAEQQRPWQPKTEVSYNRARGTGPHSAQFKQQERRFTSDQASRYSSTDRSPASDQAKSSQLLRGRTHSVHDDKQDRDQHPTSNNQLRKQLAQCNANLDKAEKAIGEVRSQNEELRQLVAQLREQLADGKDELGQCKDELGQCKNELRQCKDELGQCRGELATSMRAAIKLQKDVVHERRQKHAAMTEIQFLHSRLSHSQPAGRNDDAAFRNNMRDHHNFKRRCDSYNAAGPAGRNDDAAFRNNTRDHHNFKRRCDSYNAAGNDSKQRRFGRGINSGGNSSGGNNDTSDDKEDDTKNMPGKDDGSGSNGGGGDDASSCETTVTDDLASTERRSDSDDTSR